MRKRDYSLTKGTEHSMAILANLGTSEVVCGAYGDSMFFFFFLPQKSSVTDCKELKFLKTKHICLMN
jgi:hypothetical protein